MRVLVADDDADVRMMVAEYLLPHGVDVVEAADGMETLGLVTRSRLSTRYLDALVLDLLMPRLGGIGALKRIRELDPELAVIVMTGAIEPALYRQAQALGARAILKKPLQLATLWATIEGHVTSSPAYDVALAAARVPQHASTPPAETRVLVVDDDAEIRDLLLEFLERRGYQASVAADGASALQALMQHPADIVLLDVAMPGVSGVDALPAIRAIAPRTAVILVTGNVDRGIAKRGLAHGAFDYLVKPINFAHLTMSLHMALEVNTFDAASNREAPAPTEE